jgi:hypothetical protein
MKPQQIFYPKPELLAKYPRIHKSIRLIERITKPHYAPRGQWIVEITSGHYDYPLAYNQVWAEAEIEALFDTTERENA